MNEIKTRSSRHQKKEYKMSRRKVVSVIGTSLVFLPIAGNLLPLSAKATEVEAQGEVSQQAFIDSIGYSASSVADANDLYASVMIAQALLESSYGTSGLAAAPNYNLFGVKGSYGGQTVYMPTSEYLNGEWVTLNEPFRSYPSYAESFQDHANVLKTTMASGDYHYSGVWKSNTTSYADATAALAGRYATDPNYASKLNWLISAYGLTAYDSGNTAPTVITESSVTDQSAIGQSSATIAGQTYTVASGDTLWGISEKFGLSVDQLMASNGITAELITVGQVLQIA